VHGFRCYDNIHVRKLIALYTASAEREMSASACTRSMAGLLASHCQSDQSVGIFLNWPKCKDYCKDH